MALALPLLLLLALAASVVLVQPQARTGPITSRREDQPPGWSVWELAGLYYIAPDPMRPPPISNPEAVWILRRATLPEAVKEAMTFSAPEFLNIWTGSGWFRYQWSWGNDPATLVANSFTL